MLPDQPPDGCLGDPAPFLLGFIMELVDALWLVRPSPDSSSPEDVQQMFKRRQVWGLRWPRKNRKSAKLQVILDNTCTMGSCIVVSKDKYLPMPTGAGPNNRLNDTRTGNESARVFSVTLATSR